MNKEEKLEKLRHMKRYFWLSFLVSVVLLLLSSLMCILFHDAQVQIVEKFFGLDAEDVSEVIVMLFGLWKILIIQFTLIPAVVLQIIEKNTCACKCK